MKHFKKCISAVLVIVMLLTVFTGSPVKVAGAGRNMLFVDDGIEHGTVQIVSGRDMVSDGDTVRLRVQPEDGYEVGSWNVYYQADGRQIPVERVGFSDEYTFTVPKTSGASAYIIISVSFVITDTTPHNVYLSYKDNTGKGSALELDREDGIYAPGEAVTVMIKKKDGAGFATDGLNDSYYIDADDNYVFLKDFPDYTEVDDKTVTFSMPGIDVFIVCVFDSQKAKITVEKYFEDEGRSSSEMTEEELAERGCYDPVTRTYNHEKDQWEVCDLPLELYTNDILLFESLDNSTHVYDNGLYVTGIQAIYTIDGQTVEEDLVDYGELGPNRELKGQLVFPGVDVTIRYTVRKLYRITQEDNPRGELRPHITLALAGERIRLTPYPAEFFEYSSCIIVYANNTKSMRPDKDLSFIMPDSDVFMYTFWIEEYIRRLKSYRDVDGKEWAIFYSDKYFDHPSSEYDAHLALLSMYMTKFSMNPGGPDNKDDTAWYLAQSNRVRGFFETIGFGNFMANEDYRTRTGFDTIGLAAASRKIDGYS